MSFPILNTFSREEAKKPNNEGNYKIVETKEIHIQHLHEIFNKYFFPDFISIDVEDLDFEKYLPKIICIENVEFLPDGTEKC